MRYSTKTLLISIILLMLNSLATAVVSPTYTKRLQGKLKRYLCSDNAKEHPLNAWKYGIYEAHIAGKTFRPFRRSAISDEFLRLQADRLAKKSRHAHALWGRCTSGSTWIASLPSKANLQVTAHGFRINTKQLAKECDSYSFKYAPAQSGHSKIAPHIKDGSNYAQIDLSGVGDGTLAVICQPLETDKTGPMTWHLAPVHSGPGASFPYASLLHKHPDAPTNLLAWINQLRAAHDLAAVELDAGLLRVFSERLAKQRAIYHDRKITRRMRTVLQKSSKTFIGENTAHGRSILEIAWLLWNSPSHRDLILARQARYLGLAVNKSGFQRSVAMIFAR